MTANWETVSLGELVSFEYGKPLKADQRDGFGYPVFGSAGEVGLHSDPLLDDGPNIVVGRKGTAGSVIWSDGPCSVIDTAYFVKPRRAVNFKFAFLALCAADLPSLSAQTGVPGLNRERAYQKMLQLPPLEAQRRIVDVIDSVDTYIAALETRAEAARTARSALLHHLLSNPGPESRSFRVKDLAVESGLIGGPFGSSLVANDYVDDGIPVIRGQNLPDSSRFVSGDFVYVAASKAEELRRNQALPGDIIATQRGTLGQVAIVPFNTFEKFVVSQSQMRLRVDPNVALAEFVYLWLDWDDTRSAINSRKSATANPHINLGIFGELEGILPPISVQGEIVETIVPIDGLIGNLNQSAQAGRVLRTALLSDLLSGNHEIPASYDELQGAA